VAQLNTPRQTSRLTLREYEASDLDGLTSLYSREDVNRYLYSEPKNKDQMRSVLEAKLNRPREIIDKNVMPVAVVLRDTNRLVGDFMLRWTADQHRQGEIGGSLHPDFQGQGLAVETYAELLEMASAISICIAYLAAVTEEIPPPSAPWRRSDSNARRT
jgi:RimJ/RimL family protein N-acetyltransferase